MFRAFVAVLPPEKGEKIVTRKRPPGHESQAGAVSFFEIKKQNYVYYPVIRLENKISAKNGFHFCRVLFCCVFDSVDVILNFGE